MYFLGLSRSPLCLALAHSLNGLPVVFLFVRAALDETSPDLESAARGLGAGPWHTFWRVTLPLIRPAVLAGALVSFILSLNEFTLALFLCTPETETLPRIIWPNLRYSLSPLVAVASCVTMAVTLLGLGLLLALARSGRILGALRRAGTVSQPTHRSNRSHGSHRTN
jgi:putative spermidine/putrescine transport system permease protein